VWPIPEIRIECGNFSLAVTLSELGDDEEAAWLEQEALEGEY
jgi:hypothetical protein